MRSVAISERDGHKEIKSLPLITVGILIKKKTTKLYYCIDFPSLLKIFGHHRLKVDVSHFSAEASPCRRYVVIKTAG